MTAVIDIPPAPGALSRRHVLRHRFVRGFLHSKLAVAALVFIVLLGIVAIFAVLLAPYDPNHQELSNRLAGPSAAHWLGTDDLGRDQLSRLIFGTRVSLLAGLEVVAISAGIGVPLGVLAGLSRGWVDVVLSRINDAMMSVPGIIFALTIVAILGRGLVTSMLAVGIVLIPRFYRVARAATRDVREETFIEASRAIGLRPRRIVGSHILPNIASPVVVQVSIIFGAAVTAEASLSFLGFGVRAPTASWGSMLTAAQANLYRAPHLMYAPGIMIALTVLAFTLVGEGLRQALGTRSVPNGPAQ